EARWNPIGFPKPIRSGGGLNMLIGALTGLSLLTSVSIQPGVVNPRAEGLTTHLSDPPKATGLRPLVRSASGRVARAGAAEPRLGKAKFTVLIVDSFSSGGDSVRQLIDAHDRYYGIGTGEEFFLGPYLDALPAAVTNLVGQKNK